MTIEESSGSISRVCEILLMASHDIGLQLLDARCPLAEAPKPHTEVTVDPKLFDGYVGQCQLAPNLILTIAVRRPLFGQANQPRFELFAEGEKKYFLKAVDA